MSGRHTRQRERKRQQAQTNGHKSSFQADSRPGKWVCSSREWNGKRECAKKFARSPEAVPKVARTKSNRPGTLPEPQPWAGLLALDGPMRIGLPVRSETTVAQSRPNMSITA